MNVQQKLSLKTNFLNAYNKYSKVKINSDDKNIIEGLYKNDKIAGLRQDKGRGVVILNKTDYINKCEAFLNGTEFEELPNDPTKSFQRKVQDKIRTMKKKFTEAEYDRRHNQVFSLV